MGNIEKTVKFAEQNAQPEKMGLGVLGHFDTRSLRYHSQIIVTPFFWLAGRYAAFNAGGIVLPSGDAQRSWFPEMLTKLKAKWKPNLPWEKCVTICEDMTKFREQIWDKRNIKPAKNWCPNCEEYHESRPQPITIRSMLFALKKTGSIHDDEFKVLDKSWKKYRKEQEKGTGE